MTEIQITTALTTVDRQSRTWSKPMMTTAIAFLALALVGCGAGAKSGLPEPTPTVSPVDPEVAYFEVADRVFPPGTDTVQKIALADVTCDALDGGESRTAVLRVFNEGSDLPAADNEELLEKMIQYRCPRNADA